VGRSWVASRAWPIVAGGRGGYATLDLGGGGPARAAAGGVRGSPDGPSRRARRPGADPPMTNRAHHRPQGVFVRPHHFNAAQQHWEQVLAQNAKWDRHYNWGLRAVELDLDALANYRLVVRVLRARLRDGTLVSIPEEGTLPAIDLKPAFERGH